MPKPKGVSEPEPPDRGFRLCIMFCTDAYNANQCCHSFGRLSRSAYDHSNFADDHEYSLFFIIVTTSMLTILLPIMNHRIGRPQEDSTDSYIDTYMRYSVQGLAQTHEARLWSCSMA